MDSHGDYSPLERSRLLVTGLESGAGGGGGSGSNGGSGGHAPSVSELAARAATPTTLTSLAAQYSRFGLPSAVTGSNYALMSSLLGGAHSSEARKALLPDLPPYWSSPADGFPRYLMTGGLYPPYPPLFPPGTAESLSLLGAGVACAAGGASPSQSHHAAHYQRLLEMQKEAYRFASMSAAAANHHPALYGISAGTLPPFLEQPPVSSHGATPLSLVKQEPKELTCSEKAAKQAERRTMGFKVDLDHHIRSGKDASSSSSPLSLSSSSGNGFSTQLKEPKLSPSSSQGPPGKFSDKKSASSVSSSGSSNGQSSKKTSSQSSGSSGSVSRHHQESLRTKCVSPTDRNTLAGASQSQKSSSGSNSSNSGISKRSRSSANGAKHTKSTSSSSAVAHSASLNNSSTASASSPLLTESLITSVPTQAAAPIPLATVQHDGVVLSALASPSSAAASSAAAKPGTIKQQADKLSRPLTGTKDPAEPTKSSPDGNSPNGSLGKKDATPSSDPSTGSRDCHANDSISDSSLDISARNKNKNTSRENVNNSRTSEDKSSSDDSSEIVVDSTENEDVPTADRLAALAKLEQDRAIEETIERVASAVESDTEQSQDNVTSQTCAKTSLEIVAASSVSEAGADNMVCVTTSSGSIHGARTVYAKTQPVPTVTASGNIPVGIAVAQIRPQHVVQSRESQASESRGNREMRHVRATASSNTTTQATPSMPTPAGALPPNLVVTGHPVNSPQWLPQMPFSLQSMNSSASHYPSGFKLAHNSLIYLIPNGAEFVDQGGVWPPANFASPTGAGHGPFQSNITLPTITVDGPEEKNGVDKDKSTAPHEGPSDKIIPILSILPKDRAGLIQDAGKQHAISQPTLGDANSSLSGSTQNATTSSTATTILVNPVTSLTSSAASCVDMKSERPSVQSRGCSPIMFEDISSSLSLLSTLSSLTSKKPLTCTVGVQTCASLMKQSRRRPSPLKILSREQGIQTSSTDHPTLNPLSVQCPDLDCADTMTDVVQVKAAPDRPTYNPFTDPQILQAADGLELLSTLAEKRPKCSSLDDAKRIFPSPSDSFKSDSASVVAIEDTLSPGEGELKSGQCTPRRDVRRDLSPKWTLPKKEAQPTPFADFKAPTELDMEDLEVRVRLAEVQRQYKEKQKELAKLQVKKTEDGKPSKRGPGRPPKQKAPAKKSDDDSSSSSSKTKDQPAPQKKKRPAEELVDRVFRKLPPVKPSKSSRSIHYVKSKTGPFFKRKSASSSVKKNKDLFGFDQSTWPSYSERKHQEKLQGKSKSRHRSSSSLSEDSKQGYDTSNIFSGIEGFSVSDNMEKRGRPPKDRSLKESKPFSTPTSLTAAVKSEPTHTSSHQESGLGLLAKFALTTAASSLTAPSATSSLSLASTSLTASVTTTIHASTTTSSSSTFSSITSTSGGLYGGGLYNSCSMYNLNSTTNSATIPTMTFGSISSFMSSGSSGLMSFTSTSLTAGGLNSSTTSTTTPTITTASPSTLSMPTTTTTTAASASASASSTTAAICTTPGTSTAGVNGAAATTSSSSSSGLSEATSTEESSSATTGNDISPNKRRHEDDSDTDTSDTSPNKKRKPGRPRKINPDKSSGGTETIWAKKSNTMGLLQVPESSSGQSSKQLETKKPDPGILKPLFLDEEWTRRRSERIFLSDASPQPSPAISPAPKGEPVWKLSNFMPKQKKVLDINKSIKDPKDKERDKSKESDSTSSSSSSPAKKSLSSSASSSSASTSTTSSSSAVKSEEKESTSTSSVSSSSWSSPSSKSVEISVVKSEDAKKIIKTEDFSSPSTQTASSPEKSQKKKDLEREKTKKKKKKKTDMAVPATIPSSPSPPTLERREKRAEEHSKMKLQKAKSLHDLSQRVKKKYSKSSSKKQDDVGQKNKGKKCKRKRKISTDSSDTDNTPLSSLQGPPTPEPRSCKLQTTDLREGLKVLYLNDGLFYEGTVKALQPPDVYGVLTAGQRGSRPHILCQEEVLREAVLDVKPGSIRYLAEGTRICAFWSQQFSCLYPGTVAKSSPSPHVQTSVSVDFDDGDTGRIPIDHIRLLPSDFPIVEYEPDPLENLPKRRRRTTSDASDVRKSTDMEQKSKRVKTVEDEDEEDEDEDDDDENEDDASSDDSESTTSLLRRKFWCWEGKSTKRPGLKGKAKKVFYKAIVRGKETIRVGDSAVFVSTGRVHCPYIGQIESLWQSWSGQMMVKVRWYYHPEETLSNKKLSEPKHALFESPHEDENDVQTISHKCEVLQHAQYRKRLAEAAKKGQSLGEDIFYVAGFYDPTTKALTFSAGVS